MDSMYLRLLRLNKSDESTSEYQIGGVNLSWDEATQTYRGKHYIPSGWTDQDIHMGYLIYHEDGYETQYSDWLDPEYTAPILHIKSVFANVQDLTITKGGKLDLTEGITAQNLIDGDMTDKIQVSGNVNADRTGIYRVWYKIPCVEIPPNENTGDDIWRESGSYVTSRWVCVTDIVPEDKSLSLISKEGLYVGDFGDAVVYKNGQPYDPTDGVLSEDGYYDIEIAESSTDAEEAVSYQRNGDAAAEVGKSVNVNKHFRGAVDKTGPVIFLTETDTYVSVKCEDMLEVSKLKYIKGSQPIETAAKKGTDFRDGFQGTAGNTYTVYAEDILGNGSVKEIVLKESAPKEYKITYHLDGGKNNTENPSSYLAGQGTVNLKSAVKQGYLFAGWYLDSKLTKKVTDLSSKEDKNLDLYVKWTKVTVARVNITSLKNSGSSQLDVVYDSVSGAKGYEIVYAQNSAFTSGKKIINDSSAKVSIKSLASGTAYYVKVRAYKLDSLGQKVYGSYSAAKSYKTAPSAAQITKLTGSSQNVSVTWASVKGAEKYQIYMSASKNGTYSRIAEVSSNTLSYVKSGLSSAKSYYFKVRAYNSVNGTKVYGSFGTVKCGTTSPGKPGIVSVAGGVKKASLKWNKVTGASGYEIYMSSSVKGTYSKIAKVSSSTLNYTKTGLSSAKNYYFKIRAFRTAENMTAYGSYSDYKYSGTATSTPSITKLTGGANKITVSWGNVSGETKYELHISTSKNGTYSKAAVLNADKTSYTRTKLSNGKTYYFKVRTYRTVNGKNVYSSFSDIKAGTTSTAVPVISSVSSGNGRLTVKWGNVSGETRYELYMASSASGKYSKIAALNADTCSYTKTGLTAGKTYYFKVRTCRSVGGTNVYSAYSKVKSGKTAAAYYYVTKTGKKYHRATCGTIKNSKGLRKMTLNEVKSKGYKPCNVCRP